MKNILFIDTSNNKEIQVGLRLDGTDDIILQAIDYRKAHVVLPLVEKLLYKHKLKLKDLTGIEVNHGPGSFTGLRVGVAIANTLGMLLQIPINKKDVGEMIEPIY